MSHKISNQKPKAEALQYKSWQMKNESSIKTHCQQCWVNATMEVQVAFYSASPIYSLSAGVWMQMLQCKVQSKLQKPQI